MHQHEELAERFEENRARLRAVAYRVLGSPAEAEDAVQEAWLRLSRSGTDEVQNLGGWLTTVVARVCLDMLRSRTSRREEPLAEDLAGTAVSPAAGPEVSPVTGADPEGEALLADSVGMALLVVLDTLTPAERLAFVLHDMFAVPFTQIAPVVGCSPAAARQLASRARRRVRGADLAGGDDGARQREVVEAFLAASRGGDFEALLTVLDPDVLLRSDVAAARLGSDAELRGAPAVAGMFSGRAQAAQSALVDGSAGAVWAPGGRPRVVFGFTVTGGKIVAIDIMADAARLDELDLVILGD
jgi:RNA polymerase sigma factor (sigma-70 family)